MVQIGKPHRRLLRAVRAVHGLHRSAFCTVSQYVECSPFGTPTFGKGQGFRSTLRLCYIHLRLTSRSEGKEGGIAARLTVEPPCAQR